VFDPSFHAMNGAASFVVYRGMKLSHALLITAIVGGFAAGTARAGSGEARTSFHSGANSNLVIKRAANFGNLSNINLYIDGNRVAILGYGRSYEGVLPPGVHFVTMKQTPHLNDAYPFSQQWIRLAPGRTSVFTAIWRDGGTRIALEES
jgi:hypothetical protein